MKQSPAVIYHVRKSFFDEHAEGWLDKWYRSPANGRDGKHAKDFERLFTLLALKPGDCVLDAGCGSGVLVPFILERITDAGALIELDYSPKMIAVNRRLHPQQNIRFVLADVEDTPLEDASCDVVICFSCFPHFHDPQKAVDALARILKPGGTFAVVHFDSAAAINRHHASCPAVMYDRLPEEHAMRALFESAGLKVESFVDESGFYFVLSVKPLSKPPPSP